MACALQVLDKLLEHGKVELPRRRRELAQGNGSIANIRAASDICIKNFTKEAAIRETKAIKQSLMFRRRLRRTRRLIERRNAIRRERGQRRARSIVEFTSGGRSPVVCAEDTVNVAGARQNDPIIVLMNINTVEIVNKAKIGKRRQGLARKLKFKTNLFVEGKGNRFIRSGKGKIINLGKQKNRDIAKGPRINGTIMGGQLESKGWRGEDLVDMKLPEAA